MKMYDSVLLEATSPWRGESPGDYCYEVREIRRPRQHIFCRLEGSTTWFTQSRGYSLVGRSAASEHGVRGLDSQHDRLFLVRKRLRIYRPLLSMVCGGSIPSMNYFLFCEKGSKFPDLSIARGKERAPESNVTESARCLLVEKACLLSTFHYDLEKGRSRSPITA